MSHRTRRFGLSLVLAALLLSAIPIAPARADTGPGRGRPRAGELIVVLQPAVDPRSFAQSVGLRLDEGSINQIPNTTTYRFRITDGSDPSNKAAALASTTQVVSASPNYVGQVPEAARRQVWVVGKGAQDYADQWLAERIHLPEAHAIARGEGMVVAILDTGVDTQHPALAGRLLPGYDFIDDDTAPEEVDTGGEQSAYGHGTHVAGLVALMAPGAQILPLRTLGSDGSGDLWTQVRALYYAADQGATIINLSFSFGERSPLFDEAVAQVSCTSGGYRACRAKARAGVVVVAAAGNTAARARAWPGASAVAGLVAVAASTQADTLADFSTFGGWVALGAPGEGVVSSVPGGTYAAWSGTSMAAPLVSGVAALVRSRAPSLRPAEVIQRIVTCADLFANPLRRRLNAVTAVAATAPCP